MGRKSRFLFSCRFWNTLLVLGGIISVPGLCFSTLNFGLVCMVNRTYMESEHHANSSTVYCHAVNVSAAHALQSNNIGSAGTFAWSKAMQANLLAAYSWGAVFVVFLLGFLMDQFGVKKIVCCCYGLSITAVYLTPIAAKYGDWIGVFLARFVLGMGAGCGWPMIAKVVATWAGPRESTLMFGILTFGFPMGAFITNFVAAFLCPHAGWESVFYCLAGCASLWYVAFLFLFTDTPQQCTRISQDELTFIIMDKEDNKLRRHRRRPPLRAMLTSTAVWAVFLANAACNWVATFIMEFLPTYMSEVYNLDTTNNGLLTAAPYLGQMIGRFSVGLFAERLRLLVKNPTVSVKLYNTASLLSIAILLAICTTLNCGQAGIVTLLMFLQYLFGSLYVAGQSSSTVLIAPQFAGAIMGQAQLGGYIAALVMPYVVGVLTPNGTAAEWNRTIYVTLTIVGVGMFGFLAFGSGKVQPWARQIDRDRDASSNNNTNIEELKNSSASTVFVMRF